MKVRVTDPSVIVVTAKEKNPVTGIKEPVNEERVRFSVTLVDDDETPLWTQQGFTLDRKRIVRPPMSRTRFGQTTAQFTQLHNRFKDQLRDACLTLPDVVSTLGPEPPPLPQFPKAKKLNGTATALSDVPQVTIADVMRVIDGGDAA